MLILGSKNAGKTSMILRFLDRDEPPKPTTALEYTFGRRAKGHNLAKDVGHLWELGGGTWLSRLVDVPLNPATIKQTSVILVLDLSSPNQLWFTLDKLLGALKSRIEAVVKECQMDNPKIRDELRNTMWERLGEEVQDKDMLDPAVEPMDANPIMTMVDGKVIWSR